MAKRSVCFRFLGIPEDYECVENNIEKAIIKQPEKFLLKLGKAFAFIVRQQRITLNDKYHKIDLYD